MMSLMGFAIIFALSYNMLLGQTGMLSFGHAVYYGLGGFMTAHALNVDRRGQVADPAAGAADRRRPGRFELRHHLRLGLDETRRHRVLDDLARHRRTGGGVFADPARLLRRRGRHLDQPHLDAAPVRHQLRPADPGVLPDRRLVPAVHGGDVRLHAHAAGPHVQRGARQPGARRVRRLQHADGALHRVLRVRASSPAWRAGWRRSTTKSSPPAWSAPDRRVTCC